MRKSLRVALVLTGWVALVGVGFVAAADYETTAGAHATSPEQWPTGARLPRATDRPTIVLFAHPRCPCTRASLAELAAIMGDDRHDAVAVVAFMQPSGDDGDWIDTDTWRTAAEIERARRVIDPDGAEAARFGAATSGHVVVYDRDGRLVFSGGITGSRGTPGNNHGRQAVLAQLSGETGERVHQVFGCPLRGK
jgi:hypothetical protein